MNSLWHCSHGQSVVVTCLLVFIRNDPWWRSLLWLLFVAITYGKVSLWLWKKAWNTLGIVSPTLWTTNCSVKSGPAHSTSSTIQSITELWPLTLHCAIIKTSYIFGLQNTVTVWPTGSGGYRSGSPAAVQAWRPCPLWELSPSHPILV